jgi:hypothetical protein
MSLPPERACKGVFNFFLWKSGAGRGGDDKTVRYFLTEIAAVDKFLQAAGAPRNNTIALVTGARDRSDDAIELALFLARFWRACWRSVRRPPACGHGMVEQRSDRYARFFE